MTEKTKGRVRQRTKWSPWQRTPRDIVDPICDEVGDVMMVNNLYAVIVGGKTFTLPDSREGKVTSLSIKRHDKKPIHDWRELLRIKNELIGAECWGVEAYPPMSELMDTSNQFQLYVFPEGYIMPFGIYGGQVVVEGDGTSGPGKSRQRPLPDWYPAAMKPEEADRLIAQLRQGVTCPDCRSMDIDDRGIIPNAHNRHRLFHCKGCGGEWTKHDNESGS